MLLTVEKHREIERETGTFLRVMVRNAENSLEDVTSRCVSADDIGRWALVYRVSDAGHKFIENDAPAKELLTGEVYFDGTRGRDGRCL